MLSSPRPKWRSPQVVAAQRALWLALSALGFGACFDATGCDDIDLTAGCDDDFECGITQICSPEFFEATCVNVILCSDDSQCPSGSACIQRSPLPVRHPFEEETPGKMVCDCLDFCGGGLGGSTSSFGGSTSDGGAGASSSGGAPDGGASSGGSSQGGASVGGGGAALGGGGGVGGSGGQGGTGGAP